MGAEKLTKLTGNRAIGNFKVETTRKIGKRTIISTTTPIQVLQTALAGTIKCILYLVKQIGFAR